MHFWHQVVPGLQEQDKDSLYTPQPAQLTDSEITTHPHPHPPTSSSYPLAQMSQHCSPLCSVPPHPPYLAGAGWSFGTQRRHGTYFSQSSSRSCSTKPQLKSFFFFFWSACFTVLLEECLKVTMWCFLAILGCSGKWRFTWREWRTCQCPRQMFHKYSYL